jgi:hypothetical protein
MAAERGDSVEGIKGGVCHTENPVSDDGLTNLIRWG